MNLHHDGLLLGHAQNGRVRETEREGLGDEARHVLLEVKLFGFDVVGPERLALRDGDRNSR